ncbi:SDR family oxidoreductase [Candidatus Methylospira mobilis]|uniref:SDR family oxidoreductase n=1 Tax=Candidatus Methylospira mobilis TaxID=1808979 RepID=A0A5Q0BHR7_9GAMM|nr:SDR family oxidoreductase [Candidatus Methylospira mobilis]QFY41366.1 SDR family oxidoreductase [Candidatus Methylospira mobilis]WNV05407.1 SDR family oxidoreductase [Candidatus Methylospira mobilis]
MLDFSVAVFGASGSIGQAVCKWHRAKGHRVVGISRAGAPTDQRSAGDWLEWDGGEDTEVFSILEGGRLNAAVWAQGANGSDNIYSFDLKAHEKMYAANVTYVLLSLQALLRRDLLGPAARLCIISSIWQNIARQNKLSYCVSKSALQGLVQSLSIDLGASGYMVNAVLPGPLDTPMTRANLSAEQLQHLEKSTPLLSLPCLDDVCNLVGFLCSGDNTGITGQFIAADRGFSYARFV